jgi:hypothetical protein
VQFKRLWDNFGVGKPGGTPALPVRRGSFDAAFDATVDGPTV